MKLQGLLIFAIVFAALGSRADNRPQYEMNGTQTYVWDQDVDYYSPPIILVRTEKTQNWHRVEFNVNRYQKVCEYWEQRCVAWDSQGRCTRYEQVCGRWGHRETRVPKRIELGFHKATALIKGQSEKYELTIRRIRPFDEGEDQVSTWLVEESVVNPVYIRRMSDFNYTIEAK